LQWWEDFSKTDAPLLLDNLAMRTCGILSKMKTETSTPVKYTLTMSGEVVDFTSLLGAELELTYTGKIFCQNCGKATKKSYSQGYCYPCTMRLAECDLCILKPETCHYHLGTCREPQWGLDNCMQPHIVYLANSSGLKVGITRKKQIPTRWIDQGAAQALPIIQVNSRLVSGQIEMIFKRLISDKTDWRKMLKGQPEPMDLLTIRGQLLEQLGEELKAFEFELLEPQVWNFNYPINSYPDKVTSLSLDKTPNVRGKLNGIKGQYLIFDCGVLNIRSHAGYEVEIEGENSGSQNDTSQRLPSFTISD
jgi:hypothetical protein